MESFKFSDLIVKKKEILGKLPSNDKLVFGKTFSDHMLEVDWEKEKGWDVPKIVPYHDIPMPPSCSTLHYAIQCFEGMKAYSSDDGKKHFLFRPERNAERFNKSCRRLALPEVDVDNFIKCLAKLVEVEQHFVPKGKGFSLYLRPTMISYDPTLGVAPPNKAKFFVICSPVGPYFSGGFKPVKLLADPSFIRAFPGGTGSVKLGANYGPTIYPQLLAKEKGYDQLLWLLGDDHKISEVGTMNMFCYWKNEKGEDELITAPLDGTVLPGVTRESVIEICRKEWNMKVTDSRSYTMAELIKAQKENRIYELFGSGTAAIVSPISTVGFKGVDYSFPTPENGLAKKILDRILEIQYGEVEHEWCAHVEKIIA